MRGLGRGRAAGDSGQATIEQVGVLAVVALVLTAVLSAFLANAPGIGDGAARLICQVLTVGQGDCGSGPLGAEDREPTTPCPVRAEGDTISLGIDIGFVGLGGNRGLLWEKQSDGTYRVRQTTGGDVTAVAGAGASLQLTVADTDLGAGAEAEARGGVRFEGGQEWVVSSQEELQQLIDADNWDRVDQVAGGVPLVGGLFGAGRDLFGLGPQLPPPDRVYVAGGLFGDASAYAGAIGAQAEASGNTSRLLGYSYSPSDEGEHTFYYQTVLEGEAAASVLGLSGSEGAGLGGRAETLTSITVRDGEVIRASRSGIATGEASGLTAALFGQDFSGDLDTTAAGGTQYTATLEVDDDQDREAVLALLASAGIDGATAGLTTTFDPTAPLDPLGGVFSDRVMAQGDLTRTDVTRSDSTPFDVGIGVAMGPVAGLDGGYSTTTLEYSSPEYFDGNGFVPRTTC